jgi:hypothetical protein
MVKLFRDKDDYIENLLFVFVSGLTASFFLVLATEAIFKKAVPYILEHHFVENMYHKNIGLDKKVICYNRTPTEQIILLPSGGISIATRNSNEKEWEFSIDVCERKPSIKFEVRQK